MNLNEALEQSLEALGLDLDSDSDTFQSETGEQVEEPEAKEVAEGDEPVDAQDDDEDADEEAVEDDRKADGNVVEVPEGAVLRLPDGTEVEVDKAVLFQSDYTKKTQQLAEDRKQFEGDREKVLEAYEQMRNWYESRASNPTDWVKEIVSESPDPTAAIAKALYELANEGKLDAEFVQTFGIDAGEVAKRATELKRDSELDSLRKKVEERERSEAEQRAIQEQARKYQSEWDDIKQSNSLAFDNRDDEISAKRELLQFAMNNRMAHSLKDAYDLMLLRTGRTGQPEAVKAKPAPDPQVTEKKRASRAVTPKGNATGGPRVKKPASVREAALQSLEEYAAT
jgi:hypothetical protein